MDESGAPHHVRARPLINLHKSPKDPVLLDGYRKELTINDIRCAVNIANARHAPADQTDAVVLGCWLEKDACAHQRDLTISGSISGRIYLDQPNITYVGGPPSPHRKDPDRCCETCSNWGKEHKERRVCHSPTVEQKTCADWGRHCSAYTRQYKDHQAFLVVYSQRRNTVRRSIPNGSTIELSFDSMLNSTGNTYRASVAIVRDPEGKIVLIHRLGVSDCASIEYREKKGK
jgi:hypothetical protein